MAFHVGQKVTLIEDDPWWYVIRTDTEVFDGPQYGAVYEIAEIKLCDERPFLFFHQWPKKGWDAEEFRPVVEPKTDISIFTAMLTPKKATVQA